MKKNFLQLLVALSLLAVVRPGDAANFSVTTSASPRTSGTTTGGGSYPSGSSVTVTAVPTDDCYQFVEWTVGGTKVSTDNPYTFPATKNETLVAIFAQVEYTISTSSFPAKSGTTSGGGKKGCGTMATLTAHPNPGFAFVDWTVAGQPGVTISTATYKFSVVDDASLEANFKDIKRPTVKFISPGESEKIPTAAFPIQGTASDSVGVEAVYYNLNETGWTNAIIYYGHGFTNWYAWITLTPNSANNVSAYAVDTVGNISAIVTNKFFCTAAGLAPLSINEHLAVATEGTNVDDSFQVSFDSAVYVRISANTNDGGETGTYTYTPTGPNTAELMPRRVLPKQDTGSNNTVLELTFTDAYTAAYIDNSSNSGIFTFFAIEDSVPATLDGAAVVATSFVNTNYISTNSFGSSTFTTQDSLGANSSGTYTFTKFTSVAALVVETATSPPSAVGTTNYIVLMFTEGASPISGFYDFDSLSATNNEGSDTGTFVVNPGTDDTTFLGPVTLSGLQAKITPTGAASFTRTYGDGTFASISLESIDEPTDVGIILANTRVSAEIGVATFLALDPPYAVGLDNETVDVTWKSAKPASDTYSATYTLAGSDEGGTLAYSKLANNAPAALTGHTITATPTGKGQIKSIITFTNNIFTSIGGVAASGTYTYAPYTPTMALLKANSTSGAGIGETAYFLLDFVSMGASPCPYVYAKPDSAIPGGWAYIPGEFTFTTTK
jgi:hypothetical protein